ncbi:MAG: DUF4272 domain-containing protein [Deltaproteobacteria bacterium]|nr:DUF4272 domain-containing protein [Deltaproteobacteria bacterium]
MVAALEQRVQGGEAKGLNEEVLMERHFALHWLIRYLDQDWDHVTTDT